MSLFQDKPLVWQPAALDGVAITPSATLWANSAVAVLIASTTEAIQIDSLIFKSGSTAVGIFSEIDLMLGASGAEVVFSTIKFANYTQNTGSSRVIELPVLQRTIPAGSRLSARIRRGDTSAVASSLSVGYIAQTSTTDDFITEPLKVLPVPVSGTLASGYASPAPGGVAWTYGTAVELTTAATTANYRLTTIIPLAGATTQNIEAEVEISYGPNATTLTPVATIKTMMRTTAQGITNINLPASVDIPSGNRIYARVREGSTSVTAWRVAINYYEVGGGTPPATTGQIKVYNGTTNVAKPVKYWTGSAWVTKPLKRWNGTSWVVTNY